MSTKRTEIFSGRNDVLLCETYYERYKAADHDDTKYIPKTMVEFVQTAYVFQAFGIDWVVGIHPCLVCDDKDLCQGIRSHVTLLAWIKLTQMAQ